MNARCVTEDGVVVWGVTAERMREIDFAYADRTVRIDVDLPPHAVAAVTLELAPEPSDAGTTA